MKLLLQALVLLIVGFVALIIFLKVLGFVSIVFSLITGIALLCAFVWLIWKLLTLGNKQSSESDQLTSYKLYSSNQAPVALFLASPAISDLISSESELAHQELVSAGKIIQLDTNSAINIVDDSQTEMLKIKVLEGPSRGKVGWVSRANVVKGKTS